MTLQSHRLIASVLVCGPLAVFAACGGEVGSPGGSGGGNGGGVGAANGAQTSDGSCANLYPQSNFAVTWTCTSTPAGASRAFPQCQAGVAAGGSCQQDSTVETTNTNEPAMVTGPAPNCVDCSGGGTGTEWTCGSGGWSAADSFSCQ